MKLPRENSLNYKVWQYAYGDGTEPKTAVHYLYGLAVAWSAFLMAWPLFQVVGWLAGHRILYPWNNKDRSLSYGYKTDLYNFRPRGRRYRIAPWEIALLYAIYQSSRWAIAHPVDAIWLLESLGIAIGTVAVMVAILCIVAFGLPKLLPLLAWLYPAAKKK